MHHKYESIVFHQDTRVSFTVCKRKWHWIMCSLHTTIPFRPNTHRTPHCCPLPWGGVVKCVLVAAVVALWVCARDFWAHLVCWMSQIFLCVASKLYKFRYYFGLINSFYSFLSFPASIVIVVVDARAFCTENEVFFLSHFPFIWSGCVCIGDGGR